jgi:hypothetical protein
MCPDCSLSCGVRVNVHACVLGVFGQSSCKHAGVPHTAEASSLAGRLRMARLVGRVLWHGAGALMLRRPLPSGEADVLA